MIADTLLSMARLHLKSANDNLLRAKFSSESIGEEYCVGQAKFYYSEADVVRQLEEAMASLGCAIDFAKRARDAEGSLSSRVARGEHAAPSAGGAS